jgi:uncharacterized phiE125 gp8 family phage protein
MSLRLKTKDSPGMLLQTNLQVTTQPATEPTTVDLTRRHCRIDTLDDADLLSSYLIAARIMAEAYLSRALITQTLLWTVRPSSLLYPGQSRLHHVLELPRAPVQSVLSVNLLDDLGNATTITPAVLPAPGESQISGYVADLALQPGRLRIGCETLLTGSYPLYSTRLEYIQVSMVAGYGATPDTVPQNIVQAIMMTAAFLYENRGDAGGEMPSAARWLLDRDRLQFLGG